MIARHLIACLALFGLLPASAMATELPRTNAVSAPAPKHTITFLVAHKDDNAENMALINEFAEKVSARTKGNVVVTPLVSGVFNDELVRDGSDTHAFAVKKLYAGQVGMSQVAAKYFAKFTPAMWALEMPHVFKDHAHAARVMDGETGNRLRDSLLSDSNGRLRALAFTYSGGFRDIYSTKDIGSVAELKGMPMRLRGEPSARDGMEFLGLAQEPWFGGDATSGWIAKHADPAGLAEEAELIRIASYRQRWPEEMKHIKTVLETSHSLYLTLLTVNNQVFDALSPEQQTVFTEETQALAEKERELSIRQAAQAKAEMTKEGIKFVALSDADRALMDKMAEHVQQKHQNHLGTWVAAIKAEGPGQQSAEAAKPDVTGR